MDAAVVRAWIIEMARLVDENKDWLTQLDSAIGDADHGVNLQRGFIAATAEVEALGDAPGAILVGLGTTLISKVGGASGPLYGTAFRRAGRSIGTADEVDAEQFGVALRAALDGVMALGAARPGDKTMVDALTPAVDSYARALAAGDDLPAAVAAAVSAAEEGAVATIPLQALKGRASYLGPRSMGHEDPGAASTALLLRGLATVLAQA